ncbi:hypothetical protein MPER_02637, partial [Moniliophthora perniciosa FA553]
EKQDNVNEAQKYMYEYGLGPESARVKSLLDADSLTPTRNAFSERLLPLGFNVYHLLVNDVLHEIELGVLKAFMIHCIRELYSQNDNSVAELDDRFRRTPTFGRSVIRRFHNNISEMKKLAARDFEDILQCAMRCFEGL